MRRDAIYLRLVGVCVKGSMGVGAVLNNWALFSAPGAVESKCATWILEPRLCFTWTESCIVQTHVARQA